LALAVVFSILHHDPDPPRTHARQTWSQKIKSVDIFSMCSQFFISKRIIISLAQNPTTMSSTNTNPESDTLLKILSNDDIELLSLSDIRSFRAWDFSWPTFTKPHRFTARHTYTSDKALFAAIGAHNYGVSHSLLEAVGALKEDNSVVLYGGALVDLVLKRDASINDWDLRLIGPEFVGNEEKCVKAAKKFVDSIFSFLKEDNERIQILNHQRQQDGKRQEELFDLNAVRVSRSKSTITVIVPRRQKMQPTILQLTFSPFTTIEDLFRHSRPHCSRIAIHQGKVVLDQAARYCLESLCVVLDTKSLLYCRDGDEGPDHSRALVTEVQRTIKYFDSKGFDIILPDLDMAKVPRRNLKFGVHEVLDLPCMTAVYGDVEGNKIMVRHLRTSDSNSESVLEHQGYSGGPDINPGESIHHNIRCLVADVYDQFQFATEGEQVAPIFDFCPTLTPRMIDKSFETVKDGIDGDSLEINKVIKYFSATHPAEVFRKLLVDPIQSKKRKSPNDSCLLHGVDEAVLDELIAKEIDVIIKKLLSLRNTMVTQGFDKLLVNFPQDVSRAEDILEALYGDYAVGTSSAE
jgi:hypothetical protein